MNSGVNEVFSLCLTTLNRLKVLWLAIVCLLLSACGTPKFQPDSGISQTPELTPEFVIADDGYQLPLRQYWPPDPPETIVIALHGFNDYSKAFDAMCQYFLFQEVACIAYDQRGFGQTMMKGLWPRAGRLQQDLKMMVRLLNETYPDAHIFVAGESMGGAVILTAAVDGDQSWQRHIRGAILFAPAVWARSTQPWYQRWLLWLAVHTFPDWMPTGEGLGVMATDNIEALRAMGRDDNVIKATRIDTLFGLANLMDDALEAGKRTPLKALVLYGDKDEVIPMIPTCEMLRGMVASKLEVDFVHYPNGYHMLTRDLQAEQVFKDSVLWMSGKTKSRLVSERLSDFCKNSH